MEIKDMTIADLKAAMDFAKIMIADFKEGAIKNNVSVETIPAHKE